MRPLLVLLSLLALVLAACSPVGALNTVTLLGGLRVASDLRYGDAPRQTLDVYAPPTAKGAPVVVFIHGGSWTGGSKDEYKFVGASLARAGYVTLVISYRLAPEHRYPEYIQDAALAIRWARDHAARYGGGPNQLFVMGHSAGGFNALEVVMNARWLKAVSVPISSVRGVIGLAGPYDYDFRQFPSKNAFPVGATPEEVMPSRHVRAGPPPALLLTAANDTVVAPDNATRMAAALRAAGGQVTFENLPGLNHYTLAGALSTRLMFLGPVRGRVLAFIARYATVPKV